LRCSETFPHAAKQEIAFESGNVDVGHCIDRIDD